jgi:hypothetical protein
MRCLPPRLTEDDLASLDALNEHFEHWLREDYHLRRHGGINGKPLDRYLAGAEQTLITRLSPQEIEHAFMGRLTRCVRNDATVKVDAIFYEVPPAFIGARVDVRFPVGRPDELILYRDDAPIGAIAPVDLVENARFHAQKVELSYAELLARREEKNRKREKKGRKEKARMEKGEKLS